MTTVARPARTEAHQSAPPPRDSRTAARAGRAALADLMRPAAGALALGRALAAVSGVLAVAPYVALVHLGDVLLAAWRTGTSPDTDEVWRLVGLLVGTFTARLGVYFAALAVTHFADNRVRAHIRTMVLERLGSAPLSWFTATTSGRVRKAVQDDAATLHTLVAHGPVEQTAAVVTPVTLGVYAFVVDWRLGLLTFAVLPCYAGLQLVMMRGVGEKTAEVDARLDHVSATMVEFVTGISVVRAFGRVGQAHTRFAAAAEDFSRYYLAWCEPLLRGSALSQSVIAIAVLLLVNLGGGSLMVAAGWVTPVQVLSTTLIALVLPAALDVLTSGMWAYQLASGAALRIVETLTVPQLPEPTEPRVPQGHEVRFDHVSFSYGDTLAVDDVSLRLPEGTVTALVGPSGSGKSTLATLVARFADVDAGSVSVGGVDVRDIATADLYRTVAFVLQDSQLLRASVAANIALGRPDATLDEIRAAARAAQVDGFVASLPHGYDTVVGEEVRPSGGEAQRIAIARALLVDAPVLILDEATAFADPDAEADIQVALSRLVRGRTVLVIAHRPAAIRGADQIVVLDRGRVAAVGTHEELLDQPHYRQVWRSSGARLDGEPATRTREKED